MYDTALLWGIHAKIIIIIPEPSAQHTRRMPSEHPFACRTNSFVLVWETPTFKTCIYRLLIIHLCSFLDFPFVLHQNCCFASNDLLLEISLMVRMKNVQHEFVDLRQYLLENLFVIYVAMDKTQTSGKAKIYYHFNFNFFRPQYSVIVENLHLLLVLFFLYRWFFSNLVCITFGEQPFICAGNF